MNSKSFDFETIAAHSGLRVRVGDTLSTIPPIDASTTFTYDSIDAVHEALTPEGAGFAYARNANPTVRILEEVMADLEGADDVVAFGSGMGAISGAFAALSLAPGDTIVSASALYGVSRSLFAQLADFDVDTQYVDILDLDAVEDALSRPRVRALYFESIANPLLQVADVEGLTRRAKAHNVTVLIDNTFATPYLLRPLSLGVDMVIHSATKYIAGHGDVIAGVVAANSTWTRRLREARTVNGSVLSPFEAWLTLRGIRTLPLRMERQCASALEIAGWLRQQPWVEHVYYPGLPGNPHRDRAARLFGGRFCGIVAVDLAAPQSDTLRFMDALQLITPGTSLGDVASLALYPALSSHRGLSEEERRAVGIGDGLVRLSIGLESPGDLEADIENAARAVGLLSPAPAVPLGD